MTTAQQIQISAKLSGYIRQDGQMTAGYVVRDWNDEPVFVGTFNECAEIVGQHHGTIRDARGLKVR